MAPKRTHPPRPNTHYLTTQAIDMNQDNYLAEALKMRNLINEFNPPVYNDLTAAAGAGGRVAGACSGWRGWSGWLDRDVGGWDGFMK